MATKLTNSMQIVSAGESFQFSCHPQVPCFTECCRQLDLALTPYDVLRLKNNLKINSGKFLEKYVIISWDENQLFPTCYLTMIDDGRASCAFVDKNSGCTVYPDRPAACRTYPLGRGIRRQDNGACEEMLVLVREPHCHGFKEHNKQKPEQYFREQGLTIYNKYNDELTRLLHHPKIQQGFRPSRQQVEQYILALYNLDSFRQEISDGRISINNLDLQAMAGDDEKLLQVAINWFIETVIPA